MDILLHICCAPCAIYPLKRLKEQGFGVSGIFYNPNIHPYQEYRNRKTALEDFSRGSCLEIHYPEYLPFEFFRHINFMEQKPQRCPICWYQRLKRTALEAKEKNLEYFTTTLLVSPYQDQEALHKIGEDIAKQVGIKFYYEDFRPGFRDSHIQAKDSGMYCQSYCGCIYSELERRQKQKAKKGNA